MLKLEPARVDQMDELMDLVLEFNQTEQITTPTPLIRNALHHLLSNPSLGQPWFLKQKEEHIGYVILTFGFDLEYAGRDAWITDFYIRPLFQGLGLGTQALVQLEAAARDRGVGAIHLMVRPDNEPAKKLYGRQGFAPNPREAWIKSLR